MRKLWTNYAEVLDFAKTHSRALNQYILIQRIYSGWILPDYVAEWNGFFRDPDSEEYQEPAYCADIDHGDGSSGVSSTCGESMMDGYRLFNGDITDDDPEESEHTYRD